MWAFFTKDILVLIREKKELFVLLLMPFILTAILGFALRGVFTEGENTLELHVALVNEDNQTEGVEQFNDDLAESSIPAEAAEMLSAAAGETNPYVHLESMLDSDDFTEFIDVMDMDRSEAEQALEDEEVTAALVIPEQFTYHSLQKMLLDEGDGSGLEVIVEDHGSLRARVFHDIIEGFVRSVNFETAVARAHEDGGDIPAGDDPDSGAGELGGVETMTAQEPISSLQYYTLGMAVMFVLYTASTISERAFVEKKQYAFNRILLSGKHPIVYLSGKAAATTVFAFIQMACLFILSGLIFQTFALESMEFWAGMALITALMALCVGGVSSLLTAIALRYDSPFIIGLFAVGLISLFAFAGGSFFPVSDMPEMLQNIGSWTPNGAALTSYLLWLQGFGLDNISGFLYRIAGMAILLFVCSMLVFPKRRSGAS